VKNVSVGGARGRAITIGEVWLVHGTQNNRACSTKEEKREGREKRRGEGRELCSTEESTGRKEQRRAKRR